MDKDRKRRQLTAAEKQDAQRLAAAWAKFKLEHPGSTQEWLGGASGVGSQGVIGQYMRGVIPLNLKSLLSICEQIKVDPREISPRLTASLASMPGPTGGQDSAATKDIMEFIDTYDQADVERRRMLMDSIRGIRDGIARSSGGAARNQEKLGPPGG